MPPEVYNFKPAHCGIDQLHTRAKDSTGLMSYPVAPFLLRKVLQSMAKSAGGRFEVCGG